MLHCGWVYNRIENDERFGDYIYKNMKTDENLNSSKLFV